MTSPEPCYWCVGTGSLGPCNRCHGSGSEPADNPRMRAAETSTTDAWAADFDLWEIEPTIWPERSR